MLFVSIDPADLLRQRGFKVTAQRLAVMRAVADRPHLTAEEIVEIVRADIGAISRRAVYDAVGVLADEGILRRIQPAGSAARYEDRVSDNHHHLVCRSCGRLVDVECVADDEPCINSAGDNGFEIDHVEITYWGRCPACRDRPTQRPSREHGPRPDTSNATTSNTITSNTTTHRGES